MFVRRSVIKFLLLRTDTVIGTSQTRDINKKLTTGIPISLVLRKVMVLSVIDNIYMLSRISPANSKTTA